ncbi:MAG TPA: nitroreductase/quinone reductase family protein [Anaerolineales bacterium]|nr:nitroreductase/quinone reductase family protein [Anaerolineales bacterium]
MSPVRYRPFHTMIQRLAATPPLAWLLGRGLRYLDKAVFSISGGESSLTALLAGVPLVMVTTTGARTDLLRTSPLLPIHDPDDPRRLALIASNWGQRRYPSWYFNLTKDPRASCRINGSTAQYAAHEAAGEEYDRFWAFATDMYPGYGMYRQRAGRRIPIIVLTRIDP